MTKSEFIAKLKIALENDLDSQGVQENVAYYSAYIDEELRKGRSESEVLEELGDPWVIAQSVIDMEESRISSGSERGSRGESYDGYGYGHGESGGAQSYSGAGVHEFRVDTWWKRLLITLVVIGILILIFTVVGGILSLVMPVLVPILVIILLVQMIRRLR